MPTYDPSLNNIFEKEIVCCPTCKTDYQRVVIDRQQIVCPRCINKEIIERLENEASL